MGEISKYALVDADNRESEQEYDDMDEAIRHARYQIGPCAVIRIDYERVDSTLVWTPDYKDTWPPKTKGTRK